MPTNPRDAIRASLKPQPGDQVLAIDGRILGTVIEISEHQFCFDFRGRKVWLENSAVFTRRNRAVTLIYEEMGVLRNQAQAG